MKILLYIIFNISVFHSFAGFAALPATSGDTLIPKTAYKISKAAFLENYGRDDSSRALINFYYQRRTKGIRHFSIGLPFVIGGAAVMASAVHGLNNYNSSGTHDNLFGSLVYVVLIEYALIILGAGLPLGLVGTTYWIRYSRKHLLLQLISYFKGHAIPKYITKNKIFKGFLKYGAWNRHIRAQMRRQ